MLGRKNLSGEENEMKFLKKLLCMLLAIMMIASIFPVTAIAGSKTGREVIYSSEYYNAENVKSDLSLDSFLGIYEEEKTKNYEQEESQRHKYKEPPRKLRL